MLNFNIKKEFGNWLGAALVCPVLWNQTIAWLGLVQESFALGWEAQILIVRVQERLLYLNLVKIVTA